MHLPKLVIIRGLPGSGKSTFAKTLTDHIHVESDMYFMRKGKYCFSATDVPAAHAWCLSEIKKNLDKGNDVVVSNTFVCLWEMECYKKLGYPYSIKTAIASFENKHGASRELIERMRAKWENTPDETFISSNHILVSNWNSMKVNYA